MENLRAEWNGFIPGKWCDTIDVREFIQKNYTPYIGDESFLAEATERTNRLFAKAEEKFREEKKNGGVLGIDTHNVSSLLSYPAAYLDKDDELIVGFQTGEPLVRGVNPFGGIRMARSSSSKYYYASVIGILIFAVVAFLSLIVYNVIPSTKNEEDFG